MEWNIFVGRQPIFDRKGNIYAYELLYRNSESNAFPNISPEKATMEVLVNTFLNLGSEKVSNQSKMFVNFNEDLLYDEFVSQLNHQLVVMELLEDVEITPMLLFQLKFLKSKGFKLVLDDFIIENQHELYDELYRLVSIIKVDFMNTSPNSRRKIEQLRLTYPNIQLLAEKVETKEEYEDALKKDYLLFQGYYFAKPEILRGKDFVAEYAQYLTLFKMLNEEEPDVDEITNIIKGNISLSYKLLKYINSLAFDLPHYISSIRQAIMLMGLEAAKKWIQILIMYHIGDREAKGREKALIEHSLIRAKSCELIASYLGYENADEYFLLGMFSLLDVIMNQPLADILPEISLVDNVEKALLLEEGVMVPVLKLVMAIEAVDTSAIEEFSKVLNIPMKKVSQISLNAFKWTTELEKN